MTNYDLSAKTIIRIAEDSIKLYHIINNDASQSIELNLKDDWEQLLSEKSWIDIVQWHLEDEIRIPNIDAEDALSIKRSIDALNQERSNFIEMIDELLLDIFNDITPASNAVMNSETPAMIIDRMVILCLKIYHMREQTIRTDVDELHRAESNNKVEVLQEQLSDLGNAYDTLVTELKQGRKYMKIYKLMKMYNDPKYQSTIPTNQETE